MWEVNRVIRCESWEDLKKTAKKYSNMGYRCEVRGWDAIRDNKLTLLDDWEVKDHGQGDSKGQGRPVQKLQALQTKRG